MEENALDGGEKDFKGKISIKKLEIHPIKKYFNKRAPRGIEVEGLITILMDSNEDTNENINHPCQPEEYEITFKKGNMKMINLNYISERQKETDEVIKKHYAGLSRDQIRKKREAANKKKAEENFPKNELSHILDSKFNRYDQDIEAVELRDLIQGILRKKGLMNNRVYWTLAWDSVTEQFMNEMKYVKEGNKYVKI